MQANPFEAMGQTFNALQGAEDQRTQNRAGRAYAAGDMGGVSNALASGGQVQNAQAFDRGQQQQQVAMSAEQRAQAEQRATILQRGVRALQGVPAEQRNQAFKQMAPQLASILGPDVIQQLGQADMSDQALSAFDASLGGEIDRISPGYRAKADGSWEPIPGGPADPANARPIVTPYGIMMPPGSQMPNIGGQAPAQPQSLGSAIPPGWSTSPPNPNQPARGQPERAQQSSVSFRSTDDARQAIAQMVPGVTFTSGQRSVADNQRVGGVPTSNHLRGRAWDLVPPAGMSMAQLEQKMRSQGFRALNENDHIHVSW